jgi:hypothetical protein
MIEGKTIASYVAKADYSHIHLLAYLATYWSPRDIVYETMITPRHPLRLLCCAADAIDGVCTVGTCVDTAKELQPENKLLPIMAGIVLYNTGSLFKYLDARARGEKEKTFLCEPNSDVTRGAVLALLYYFFAYVFQQGKQRNRALVVLNFFEVVVEVLEDYFDFDAYARLHEPGLYLLRSLRRHLALGPATSHVKAAKLMQPAAQHTSAKPADLET